MNENKLNGQSSDIVSENIEKMIGLFPEIKTENGINFQKLQEILGENVDYSNEKYDFIWNGKSESIKESQKTSNGTLIPCIKESKNWNTTQNLYIEGDNLEVLKLFQKSYNDKIKMIYIDPPYNTGNDFIYTDNYTDNLENYIEKDKEGFNLSSNPESNGRYHTNWLNMIYPRLRLARNLLTPDGVIFISIDDNEYDNLKKICDMILGDENYVGTIVWRKKRGHGRGNSHFILQTEYILTYAKNLKLLPIFSKRLSEHKLVAYNYEDSLGKYKRESLEHHSPKGMYERKTLQYPIYINNEQVYCSTGQWLWNEEHVDLELKNYINKEKNELKYLDIFKDSQNRLRISKKIRLNDDDGSMRGETPLTLINEKEISTNSAASDIKKLFDFNVFDFSKPVKLINELIEIGTINENDIILDFFSGSATTAQSTFEINQELNKNNNFILIQLPEVNDKSEAFKRGYKNICEIGKERIRRAGDKIVKENGIDNLDIGFKVFKLDSSNLTKWNPNYDNLEKSLISNVENIIPNRTELDLVYEIMLKYGLKLTEPIEKKEIKAINIYVINFGALIICLDNNITKEIAEEIIKIKDYLNSEITRVVFKDNGFKSDKDKTNIKEILKLNNISEFITI